jgi:hypothetical protein
MVASDTCQESVVGSREHREWSFDSIKRKKFLTSWVNIGFKEELSSVHLSAKSNHTEVCREAAWSPAYRGPL